MMMDCPRAVQFQQGRRKTQWAFLKKPSFFGSAVSAAFLRAMYKSTR